MGDVSGLLRNDLRRLIPYIVMTPLAAIMIAMGVSLGTLIIPMIVAAYATCSLFSDDRGCGWLTFAASAGISRRRIIASRILALLILSIPVAVIPAICTVMISPMEDHILAGLGIGTYLAGIGYGCMVCFPRPYENVSPLRCMIGQFAFLAASVLALLAVDAVTGDVAVGFAVCVAMGFATMAWTYVLAVDRFARTDL